MKKLYFSVDVETSGPVPGKYSMLSVGACIIGDLSKTFYREIKPLNNTYRLESMQIGSLGLHCLNDLKHLDIYNAKSPKFNPRKVLDVLSEKGDTPEKVMEDFAEWIVSHSKGCIPIEVAAPIKFDGAFTAYYFNLFYKRNNPFGFSGLDINSLYKGVVHNLNAHISQLGIDDNRETPHNALDDAIQQAKEADAVIKLLNKIKKT
jgi:ribonuclease T